MVAQLSQVHLTAEGLVSDKEADMALVSIQSPDGRRALPVFTCVDYLTQWHAQARPVAASMRKTSLSAVEDNNQLIVVNPGQDPTFVVRRPAIWAIAKEQPWVPSYNHGAVSQDVRQLIRLMPQVEDVQLAAAAGVDSRSVNGRILAGGGHGPELEITLVLKPGMTREQLDTTITDFQQRLAASEVISELVDSVQIKLSQAS